MMVSPHIEISNLEIVFSETAISTLAALVPTVPQENRWSGYLFQFERYIY
jgi:hypothetical protein